MMRSSKKRKGVFVVAKRARESARVLKSLWEKEDVLVYCFCKLRG
jgi:hypothetical protein